MMGVTFQVCDCVSESSVCTEDGRRFRLNLYEGFARCEDGQADLTEEQIKCISEILENQT